MKMNFVDPSEDRRINRGRYRNPAGLLERPEVSTLPLVKFEVNFEVHTLRKLHFREKPEPSIHLAIKKTLRCERILQKHL